MLFNPKRQIEKSWDGKRKKELDTLSKVFEEYYNDKNCYPKPSEVCLPGSETTLSSGNIVCKICGGSLDPYLSRLPCDPQHPSKDYLYEVDSSTCPSFYRIYAKLSNESDPSINEVGCSSGCAPEGYSEISGFSEAFNYGKTSPNTSLPQFSSELIQWACKCGEGSGSYTCEPCCYFSEGNDCPEGITLDCYAALNEYGYKSLSGSQAECNFQCEDDCKE